MTSNDDAVDARVRAARESGDLDHLPGRGKPLVLDDLDHLPIEQRPAALLMRSVGEVPVAVALVREIRGLRAQIEQSGSVEERERALALIQQKLLELGAALRLERLAAAVDRK